MEAIHVKKSRPGVFPRQPSMTAGMSPRTISHQDVDPFLWASTGVTRRPEREGILFVFGRFTPRNCMGTFSGNLS